MNPSDMLDHALGKLDGPELDAFERELATDPDASRRAERLAWAIHSLVDDGDDSQYNPPPGLADRTILFVRESKTAQRSVFEFVPVRVPFRWADVAVAAGILFAGLITLLPAVERSRAQMNQAGCTDNLQRLGRALWHYGNDHRHFPFGPETNAEAHTGSFAAMLQDDGYLKDLTLLDCPSNGAHEHPPLPRFGELAALARSNPDAFHRCLCWDYAYNVSHKGDSGRVDPIKADYAAAAIPILADKPDHERFRRILSGNSANHGGRGQNVLYTDLHVGWHNTRRLSPLDADMYLNDDGELAPGCRKEDAVLCPSEVPFVGWRHP